MGAYHRFRRRWVERGRMEGVALRPAGAIADLDAPVTYADLDRRARAAAGWLQAHGIGPGDVVALQLPRCLALLELQLGALALGATTLALNDRYPPAERAYYLEDARPRLAVLADTLPLSRLRAELDATPPLPLDALPERDEDALAALMYTSGTTGRPKGAMISHRNLMATVTALDAAWGWTADDHLLHALPLFHIHGLFVAQYGALYAAATTSWVERFDARRVLELLEARRCSVFMGVPTFYHRFLSLPADVVVDLSAMRLFTSGSAPLPAADMEAFHRRFGHRILERYGMTEVGIVLSNPLHGARVPGTVGFPLPGVQARITDPETGRFLPPGAVGELRVRGPGVIAGYLGLPEQTDAALGDGWMHTGDLAVMDPDGRFSIVGRQSELIITGGFNVYPREVEAVLQGAPGVAEAAVVGVPDPDLGERVVAAIVVDPRRAPSGLDLAAIRDHARRHLAPYKCPKELRVVQDLPRNAMGKVQKRRLAESFHR
ncbi:MAG: malonyl-CoA synthase [Deltaproteobacteria bacterium]|nr:MAG: malonyl-CoA synthase [Deltaproteobacteria bacterium]